MIVNLLKKVFHYGITIFIYFILFFTYLVYIAIYNLPNYKNLEHHEYSGTTRIFDISGNIIAEYALEKRIFVKIQDVPKKVINAFLSAEDKNFYEHQGIDLLGMARLPIVNFMKILKKERLQGASTITQQVVKNLLLSNEYSVMRKIKELALSIKLTQELTKDQILELYLNHIYLGKGAYGVASAAKIYFNKSLEELTIAECAFISALPKAPSLLDKNYIKAKIRRNYVIDKMLHNNFISTQESVLAKEEEIKYKKQNNNLLYGVEYFSEAVRQKAIELFGENIFYNKGLNIYTSLNMTYQKFADTALKEAIDEFENKKLKNKKQDSKILDSNDPKKIFAHRIANQKLNGGLVVMDYETGRVFAIIGGYSYNDSKFNRATQAKRQIGSLVKTFIYLSALENNIEPNSIWLDSPISLTVGDQVWAPKNYENNFLGNISMQTAFEKSRNTVTVRISQKIGINNVIEILQRFNINDNPPRFFSIALGAVESTLLKTTAAFGSIMNDSKKIQPSLIDLVKDSKGNIIYKRNKNYCANCSKMSENPKIIQNYQDLYLSDKASSYQIKTLLNSVIEKGNSSFMKKTLKNMVLSGKTGTTNNSRDVWFIGASTYPKLVVGTYLGYDIPFELGKKTTGRSLAAPVFEKFMQQVKELYLANNTKEDDFNQPLLKDDFQQYLIFNGREYLKKYKNTKHNYLYNKNTQVNEIDGGYDIFEDANDNQDDNYQENNVLNHYNEIKEDDFYEMQEDYMNQEINNTNNNINNNINQNINSVNDKNESMSVDKDLFETDFDIQDSNIPFKQNNQEQIIIKNDNNHKQNIEKKDVIKYPQENNNENVLDFETY
ncbi:MAG: PBP1A family penicillin-binding protein [Rickettsiales bacterium]